MGGTHAGTFQNDSGTALGGRIFGMIVGLMWWNFGNLLGYYPGPDQTPIHYHPTYLPDLSSLINFSQGCEPIGAIEAMTAARLRERSLGRPSNGGEYWLGVAPEKTKIPQFVITQEHRDWKEANEKRCRKEFHRMPLRDPTDESLMPLRVPKHLRPADPPKENLFLKHELELN